MITSSCKAPYYIQPNLQPEPTVQRTVIQNTFAFGVQNMDEKAKVGRMICHYDGFDVQYDVLDEFIISLTIINNSNKSLIIDKSKSYVLYDGYSNQLFKDVRSSRSTTFNNVEDAVNNVMTNEGGVLMTIPPYAKWELPRNEVNLRSITKFPDFVEEAGIHPLTLFDNKEVVEFVIPYSYDYTMKKWSTCRNRIFVNSVNVEYSQMDDILARNLATNTVLRSGSSYTMLRLGAVDDTEFNKIREQNMIVANRVDEINWQRYVKHRNIVKASHIYWGIVTLPTIYGPIIVGFRGCDHLPVKYGDKIRYYRGRTY